MPSGCGQNNEPNPGVGLVPNGNGGYWCWLCYGMRIKFPNQPMTKTERDIRKNENADLRDSKKSKRKPKK
jgi:hypothetical protein